MVNALTGLSVLTCLVSAWMTAMFLVLRHPHYLERATLGAAVFAGAALLAAAGPPRPASMRAALGVWAAALAGLGLWALFADGGDDGWVLIAGVLFVAEGATALFCVARPRR